MEVAKKFGGYVVKGMNGKLRLAIETKDVAVQIVDKKNEEKIRNKISVINNGGMPIMTKKNLEIGSSFFFKKFFLFF